MSLSFPSCELRPLPFTRPAVTPNNSLSAGTADLCKAYVEI